MNNMGDTAVKKFSRTEIRGHEMFWMAVVAAGASEWQSLEALSIGIATSLSGDEASVTYSVVDGVKAEAVIAAHEPQPESSPVEGAPVEAPVEPDFEDSPPEDAPEVE